MSNHTQHDAGPGVRAVNGQLKLFTIVARNYLGQAAVLFDSVRKRCGDIAFCCYVVDGYEDGELPQVLRGHVFDCRKLGLPHFEEMAFRYDVIEFSTSLKPYIFRHIFEVEGYGSAAYFDPDTKLYDGLRWLEERLAMRSIIVTPHVLDVEANRLTVKAKPPAISMASFLFVGSFNFGFVAIKNDACGRSFTAWWAEVLRDKCFVEISQAMFVDQKWADLLPGFFGEHLDVLRDAGANVAYWNLHERDLTRDADSNYLVKDSRLKFVHYSCIDLHDPNGISTNIPESRNINLVTYPEYRELYSDYKAELVAAGHPERRKTPYRFNAFDDGTAINKLHRRLYSRLVATEDLPQPFSASGNFYALLRKNRLLGGPARAGDFKASEMPNLGRKRKAVEFVFFLLFRLLGAKYYLPMLNEMRRIANLENNTFLIRRGRTPRERT